MLEYVNSPKDIKRMTYDELETLAAEIRRTIIDTVAENGGHLASNLGIVEATIAIHRVFDAPRDKIIFDVSHQSYAHKLLTGRRERFDTLRRDGGISGFTSPAESEYDTVVAGHSGSSISQALGIAEAAKLAGSDAYSVAIVGDGSFTNGMIYEAINNCAEHLDRNLIIILNDNEMSISENVGGISRYLSGVRTSRKYLSFKHTLDDFLLKIPVIGIHIARALKWLKDSFKHIFITDTLFENLGVPYIGPVDGNSIEKLEAVLYEAKLRGGVWLVHIVTKKGLGYEDAERHPEKYHSTGSFDASKGVSGNTVDSFTSKFSEFLCQRAHEDSRIYAVTSAMKDGTGLDKYAELFPYRYCDVGIAEEHAVAFCGGLAISGMNPVCAIYSTFAQRVFDQVYHDVAIDGSHITLALDHCGIVPGDGVTHQGIYDVSLFSPIPNVSIFSPETYEELDRALGEALGCSGVGIVRYPKGREATYDRTGFISLDTLTYRIPDEADAVIVTYGIITEEAVAAAEALLGKYKVGIVKLLRVAPLPGEELFQLIRDVKLVYVLEEGILRGGVGESIAAKAERSGLSCRIIIRAIDGVFISHGDRTSILRRLALDSKSVSTEVCNELGKCLQGALDRL